MENTRQHRRIVECVRLFWMPAEPARGHTASWLGFISRDDATKNSNRSHKMYAITGILFEFVCKNWNPASEYQTEQKQEQRTQNTEQRRRTKSRKTRAITKNKNRRPNHLICLYFLFRWPRWISTRPGVCVIAGDRSAARPFRAYGLAYFPMT